MLRVKIPDKLENKINELARTACQTPEEYVLEIIEERLEHESAYSETYYLARSKANEKRLDKAVEDINSGKFEPHELIDD